MQTSCLTSINISLHGKAVIGPLANDSLRGSGVAEKSPQDGNLPTSKAARAVYRCCDES